MKTQSLSLVLVATMISPQAWADGAGTAFTQGLSDLLNGKSSVPAGMDTQAFGDELDYMGKGALVGRIKDSVPRIDKHDDRLGRRASKSYFGKFDSQANFYALAPLVGLDQGRADGYVNKYRRIGFETNFHIRTEHLGKSLLGVAALNNFLMGSDLKDADGVNFDLGIAPPSTSPVNQRALLSLVSQNILQKPRHPKTIDLLEASFEQELIDSGVSDNPERTLYGYLQTLFRAWESNEKFYAVDGREMRRGSSRIAHKLNSLGKYLDIDNNLEREFGPKLQKAVASCGPTLAQTVPEPDLTGVDARQAELNNILTKRDYGKLSARSVKRAHKVLDQMARDIQSFGAYKVKPDEDGSVIVTGDGSEIPMQVPAQDLRSSLGHDIQNSIALMKMDLSQHKVTDLDSESPLQTMITSGHNDGLAEAVAFSSSELLQEVPLSMKGALSKREQASAELHKAQIEGPRQVTFHHQHHVTRSLADQIIFQAADPRHLTALGKHIRKAQRHLLARRVLQATGASIERDRNEILDDHKDKVRELKKAQKYCQDMQDKADEISSKYTEVKAIVVAITNATAAELVAKATPAPAPKPEAKGMVGEPALVEAEEKETADPTVVAEPAEEVLIAE